MCENILYEALVEHGAGFEYDEGTEPTEEEVKVAEALAVLEEE